MNWPGSEKTEGESMFIEYIDNKIQELENEDMLLEKENRKDWYHKRRIKKLRL